ncbi:hypothetical protein ACFWDI_16135 [Streptomyces sp. NPDC060064]|uniref:hypothetical protein n=1 Tax=Streptomyces sp. NPDC060064 TaxID=3347049 RepID=UPI0036B0AE6C
MAAHAAVPARHHGSLGWAMPATLGVVYGFYAAFVHRNGGAITGGDVLLGVVAGVAFAALAYTLGRFQHSLPRELRAAAYGALCAASMGYLISLAGGSVLRSSAIALAIGAGVAVTAFYIFYERE